MSNKKKPRVLHILSSLKAGGAETNLLSLMQYFDQEKFEHAVAYGGEGGELEEEFSSLNINLIKLSDRQLSLRGLIKITGIIGKIVDYKPDIIHAHLDIPNVYGLLAGYVTGAKVILHFHGFGILYKELAGFSKLDKLIWWMLSRSYRYCDCAFSICDFQLPYLKRAGIAKQKIRKIKNGITIEQKNGLPMALDELKHDNAYCFVNVARFHKQKNHEILIMAFSDVVKHYPNAYLVLAGDGPLYSKIEKRVNELGLQDKVSLLGMRRDIPNILASCNCFVQASGWELSPITLLEAMLAKMPVIATNVGGVSEIVTDQESGLLIDTNNITSLTEAMIYMATHSQHADKMGTCGYEKVVNELSNSGVAKNIEDVYMDIV